MLTPSKIQNAHLLTELFGKFPSFHDTEVHRINLIRGEARAGAPTLKALIHVWEMTSDIDEKGRYITRNHVLVEFSFSKISHLEMDGFNHQNVLSCLVIRGAGENQSEGAKIEVLFQGIYGVSAQFLCEAVSIESVSPCDYSL